MLLVLIPPFLVKTLLRPPRHSKQYARAEGPNNEPRPRSRVNLLITEKTAHCSLNLSGSLAVPPISGAQVLLPRDASDQEERDHSL